VDASPILAEQPCGLTKPAAGRGHLRGNPNAPTVAMAVHRSNQDCHGACLKTRCTTLAPMPSFLRILWMPSPLALSATI
jgi:hypothetical protein